MQKILLNIFYILLINQSTVFAGTTQLELNQQSYQRKIAAQQTLNKALQNYRKNIDPAYIEAFNTSEAAWYKYAQSYCKFISKKNIDGSIYPLVLNNCLTEQIIEHTKQLNQLLHCREGDLQCPGESHLKFSDLC